MPCVLCVTSLGNEEWVPGIPHLDGAAHRVLRVTADQHGRVGLLGRQDAVARNSRRRNDRADIPVGHAEAGVGEDGLARISGFVVREGKNVVRRQSAGQVHFAEVQRRSPIVASAAGKLPSIGDGWITGEGLSGWAFAFCLGHKGPVGPARLQSNVDGASEMLGMVRVRAINPAALRRGCV